MTLSFEDLNEATDRSLKRLNKEIRKALTVTAFQAERAAKVTATSYPKGRPGRLRSSISGRVIVGEGGSLLIELRAGDSEAGGIVNYAPFVEFGTRYIQPRLFMQRAIDKEAPGLEKRLQRAFVNAFKR